jgi:membrane protein required for colicin V production
LIDIIFGILLIFAAIKGYKRGFIIALFSAIALIVGIAAALKFSTIMATIVENHISVSTRWIPTVSFVLVFLLAVILVNWGGKLIEKTFKIALLGWLNRLGGILLYIALYTLIFSVLLFYAEKINILNIETTNVSKVYPYIKPLGPKVIDGFGKFIPIFKDMFQDLEFFFEKVKEKFS